MRISATLQILRRDDYVVLPHQRLWSSGRSTYSYVHCRRRRFLLQPLSLVCGTVFHRTSLLPPALSSVDVLNHISSHFLIPISDSSHLYSARAVTRHFGHYYFLLLHLTFTGISCMSLPGRSAFVPPLILATLLTNPHQNQLISLPVTFRLQLLQESSKHRLVVKV